MSVKDVSFKFDSRIISNIGEQSVSDKIAALTEIIKNSYDADANNVYVTFRKDQILIQDDGHGITEDDMIDRYLVVATGIKELESYSPKIKRRVTGEKGMGRFAAQKLGNVIRIISTPECDTSEKISGVIRKKNEKSIDLEIDWNKYGKPGTLASEVKLPLHIVERNDAHLPKPGTQLSISFLREKWTVKSVDEFKRSVGQFLSPNKVSEETFKVFVYAQLDGKASLQKPTDEQNMIEITSSKLENSTVSMHCTIKNYKANFEIREGGQKIFATKDVEDKRTIGIDSPRSTKVMQKTTFKEIDLIDSLNLTKQDFVGDFSFEVHFWPRGTGYWGQKTKDMISSLMSKKSSDIETWLKTSHGIKIYNDGIKVRPYGEIDSVQEDWLRISAKAFTAWGGDRGVTFRNERIVGLVDLTRKNNPNIKETTTRERLIENEQYESLVTTLNHLLGKFEKYLDLKKKQEEQKKAREHNERTIHDQAITTTAKSVAKQAKKLEKLAEQSNDPKILDAVQGIVDDAKWLDRASREQQKVRDMTNEDTEAWNSIMRSYSAFGAYTINTFHDIQKPVNDAYSFFDRFHSYNKKLEDMDVEELKEYTLDIKDHAEGMEFVTSFVDTLKEFTQSTAFRKDKKAEDIHLKEKTETLVRILSMGSDITFDCKINPDLTIKMHKNDFFSIVSNLFTNSLKAMKIECKSKNPKIEFTAKSDSDSFVLVWTDNGCGIEKEEQEEIFEPLVKGKAGKATDVDVGRLGTGLGLNIIRDAIQDYRGEIKVTNLSHPTEFTIIIPKNKLS